MLPLQGHNFYWLLHLLLFYFSYLFIFSLISLINGNLSVMVMMRKVEKMTVKMEVGCLGVQPLPADATWWVGACRDCGGLEHSTQQGYGWFVKTE